MLLNNQQITEEIKNEIKICIEMNENGILRIRKYKEGLNSAEGYNG